MLATETLQKLLRLQEVDSEKSQLEANLKLAPQQKAHLEAEIAAAESQRAEHQAAYKAHEVERERVDLEVDELKAKKVKLRNQQLSVKKNEEYQALEREIAQIEERTGELEEREIEILYQLDDERDKLDVEETAVDKKVADARKRIEELDDRETDMRADLEVLEKRLAEAREQVPADLLSRYDNVKARRGLRFPFVAPLEDEKCKGCHLRVTGETLAALRQDSPEIPQCENCGRIVYKGP